MLNDAAKQLARIQELIEEQKKVRVDGKERIDG